MKSPITFFLFGLLLVATSGCHVLEPKADLTQFYVLRSTSKPAATETGAANGPHVRVGPGSVAGYLSVTPIVTMEGPNHVKPLAIHHWAEPLPKGIARALGEDLRSRMPEATVIIYPDSLPTADGLEIQYLVNRFDGALEGAVTLDVSWQLIQRPGGKVISSTHAVYVAPVLKGSNQVLAYVERLSLALEHWADDLAKSIQSVQKR